MLSIPKFLRRHPLPGLKWRSSIVAYNNGALSVTHPGLLHVIEGLGTSRTVPLLYRELCGNDLSHVSTRFQVHFLGLVLRGH